MNIEAIKKVEKKCPNCDKKYKSDKWLNKHFSECVGRRFHDVKHEEDNDYIEEPKKNDLIKTNYLKKKLKIAPQIRFQVWQKYIGNQIIGKCFCCYEQDITPFTNYKTFHTGHITSEYNGGKIVLDNLLPICANCNNRMGTTNWDVYTENNNLPLRTYGEKLPQNVIISSIIIQIKWRNYKKNKLIKQKLTNEFKHEVQQEVKQVIKKIKRKKYKKNKKYKKQSKKKHNYLLPTKSLLQKYTNKSQHLSIRNFRF